MSNSSPISSSILSPKKPKKRTSTFPHVHEFLRNCRSKPKNSARSASPSLLCNLRYPNQRIDADFKSIESIDNSDSLDHNGRDTPGGDLIEELPTFIDQAGNEIEGIGQNEEIPMIDVSFLESSVSNVRDSSTEESSLSFFSSDDMGGLATSDQAQFQAYTPEEQKARIDHANKTAFFLASGCTLERFEKHRKTYNLSNSFDDFDCVVNESI